MVSADRWPSIIASCRAFAEPGLHGALSQRARAIPLAACLQGRLADAVAVLAAVWTERARAAYLLTFGVSFAAAAINVPLGLLVAWVLVRYEFPLKRLLDSLVDLPFALPTAVAGLVYSSLYVPNGWLGRFLVPLGIQGAYSRLAIVLVLTFIGLPFVVRTVQPVLETLDAEVEEAAATLGATRWQTFRRVMLPSLLPAHADGLRPGVRPGAGRIRLGGVRLGQHHVQNRDRSGADRGPARGVHYAEATAMAVVLLVIRSPCWLRSTRSNAGAAAMKAEADRGQPRTGRARAIGKIPLWFAMPLILAGVAVVAVPDRVPVVNVFYQALSTAGDVLAQPVDDPDTRHAILLTLIVAPSPSLLNVVFGVAAAWADRAVSIPGRTLLVTLIDLPFAVSPVVAGLMFVLLFGLQGYFGPWLREHGVKIIFACRA